MTGVDLLLVITDPTEGSNECFVGCFMVSMLHCYMDVLSAFIYNDEETLKRKKHFTVRFSTGSLINAHLGGF